MSEPIFIGVGNLKGYWDFDENKIYQDANASTIVSGATLSNGDWSSDMDGSGSGAAGRPPKAGDYFKVINKAGVGDDTAGFSPDGIPAASWVVGDYIIFTVAEDGVTKKWKRLSSSDVAAGIVVGEANSLTWKGELNKYGSSKEVSTDNSTSALDKWIKFAETLSVDTDAATSGDTQEGVFLVSIVGAESDNAATRQADHTFLVRAVYTHSPTGTHPGKLTIEPLQAGELNSWNPATDIEMRWDGSEESLAELWIKTKKKFARCYVAHLGGSDNVDGGDYEDTGWIVSEPSAWADNTNAGLSTKACNGTWATKIFDDITVAGGNITMSNGSTLDSTSAGVLLLTEDVVKTSGDLTVGGNDIKASDGTTAITLSGADVKILGNLTVDGATTTVQSTTITVDDKNIELGSVASPSDSTADGGGITLKGSSDKEIKWVNSTDSWTFNQGVHVTSGNIKVDSGGELQTTKIAYTDGDDAITIADGGAVTLSDNLTLGSGKEIQTEKIAYTDGDDAITIADGGDITLAGSLTVTNEIIGPAGGSLAIKANTDMIFEIDEDANGSNAFYWKDGGDNTRMTLTEAGALSISSGDINAGAGISTVGNITIGGSSELRTETIASTTGNDAIKISSNGHVWFEKGIIQSPSVQVSSGNSGASTVNRWIKFAEMDTGGHDSTDSAQAVFLVHLGTLHGYADQDQYHHDLTFLVRAVISPDKDNLPVGSDSLVVEPLHSAAIGDWDPSTDIVMLVDNATTSTAAQLWVKTTTKYSQCYVTHLGGQDSQGDVESYEAPDWVIKTGQSWQDALPSGGGVDDVLVYGQWATKVFDDITVAGGKITLSNGAIIDSETNGSLTLTEDLVKVTGDLQVVGNDIRNSQGEDTIKMDADQNVEVVGDLTVSGGDITGQTDGQLRLKADTDMKFQVDADDSGAGGAFWFLNASGGTSAVLSQDGQFTMFSDLLMPSGSLVLGDNKIYNGETELTITLDADQNTTLAGDLTVSGGKITLSNGAIIDSETNGELKLTEDLVNIVGGSLQIGGNIIKASDGGPTIILDTSDNVEIVGDLTVSGGDINGPADGSLNIKSDKNIVLRLDKDQGSDPDASWFMVNDGQDTTKLALDESGNLTIAGDLELNGHDIKNSSAEVCISIDADQNTTLAGDLTVSGGDIKGPTDADLLIRSDVGVKVHLDDDGTAGQFDIVAGSDSGIFRASPTVVHSFGSHGFKAQYDVDSVFYGLTIQNDSNSNDVSDMTGSGVIQFHHGTSEGVTGLAGSQIRSEKEQNWRIVDANTRDASLVFSTAQNGTLDERMIIKSDGKVGIGTTSPSRRLHVHQANSSLHYGLTIRNNASGEGLQMGNNADGSSWINNNESDKGGLHLGGAGSAYNNGHVFISGSGNVGIGTITPESRLHLQNGSAGTIATTDGALLTLESNEKPKIHFQSPGGYGGSIIFGSPTDNDEGQIDYDHGSDRFLFKTGGNTKMAILGDNVGIGVTDPDEKLEVAGRIHISSEVAAPSAPSAGNGGVLYTKSDGKIYWISDDLAETDLTQGGTDGYVDAANGVNNRIATFTDANSLNGEANLTFDGTDFGLVGNADISQNTAFGSTWNSHLHQFTGSLHLTASGADCGITATGYNDDFGIHLYGSPSDGNIDNATKGMDLVVDQNGRGSLEILSTGGAVNHFRYQAGTTFVEGGGKTVNLAVSGSSKFGTDTNSTHWFSGSVEVELGGIKVLSSSNAANEYGIHLPQVDGFIGKAKAFSFDTYSSIRFKKNVSTIDNALAKTKQLRGVTFDWKTSDRQDIGLIAEEVAPILPECVSYDQSGVVDGVNYPKVVSVLVEAVKEQNTLVENLYIEIEDLRSKLPE